MARKLVHGTCVALGADAVLLRGPSGSGKSDLAFRFLALPGEGSSLPKLVADDQLWVTASAEGELIVSAPKSIAGKIEVRGLGIVTVPFVPQARLNLVCDLVKCEDVPRLPEDPWERTEIAGVAVPLLKLSPFEPSTPLKLKMALLLASSKQFV
ncbi:MAG: aldolase [Alphaproteobacteria bacterium]|nr:aldolase [Alphaproteobacteria bacterium]